MALLPPLRWLCLTWQWHLLLNYYLHSGDYVLPGNGICLSFCILATSHKIYWSDLQEYFTRVESVDKELIKFWKSSASKSRYSHFWRILEHCEIWHFSAGEDCANYWTSRLNQSAFLAQYSITELMQRIFKYGNIQNTTVTPDKELNILIYRMPSYLIICRSYKHLKMVQFLGPPCTQIM